MPYLFPEEDLGTDISPTQPTQPSGDGEYLFGEEQAAPPVEQAQPRPQLRHTPPETPQIFPTGQDHVAREVLGLKPKPYLRSDVLPESHFGILGDFGSGLASGILQTGETAMRAARTFDPPGGVDYVRNATTAGIERIKAWEEEYPRIFKISQEAQDSAVRRAIYGGVQGWVPSLTFGALGAAAGTFIGGPAGTMVGFGLGAGGMFGLAEYDQFMEDAEAQGISRDKAFPYAVSSAIVEGGGEAIADMLAFKLLGATGGAIAPFKGSVKKMLKVALKPMALAALKQMPVEVGTEMVQGSSQVFLRNLAGMDAGTPWRAAVESIGPAMVMTMLFGASGSIKQSVGLRSAHKALEDGTVDPTVRQNAADFVTAQLSKVDKDLAELWKFNTRQYIEAGYGIPIDRKTAEYLAWGESSNWSPEMATKLSEGKDIKLLPEGQGFVLTGEAYDPDDKAEYDMYSPEMADQLLQAKDTRLLPDGQGFTMAGDATVFSPQLAKRLKADKEKKRIELKREAVTPEVTPVEAAARGVEAAIEVGRPEDIAQAERRLERRAKREGATVEVGTLVRAAITAKPDASIGDIYRSVKAQVPAANRQDVAKVVRQERRLEVPTSRAELARLQAELGIDEFQDSYNPLQMESRLIKELTDQGVSREDAKAQVRPTMDKYSLDYEAVNKKALEKRAEEQARKEKKAQAVKKAAEAPKKLKAKPKPEKKKLKAPVAKKKAQPPTKEEPKVSKKLVAKKKVVKPTAAEAIEAMAKPEMVKPTARPGKTVPTRDLDTLPTLPWSAEERERLRKMDFAAPGTQFDTLPIDSQINKRIPGLLSIGEAKPRKPVIEKEIKPSAIRAGVAVDTPDGKGIISESPQPKQWVVRMTDGWAKGDTLIFAESEIKPEGVEKKLRAKPKAQAKLGERPTLTAKERKRVSFEDEEFFVTYDLYRGKEVAGAIQLDVSKETGEVYVDWFEHDDDKWGQMGMVELRKLMKQFKKENKFIKRYTGFRVYEGEKEGKARSLVDVRAKLGKIVHKTYEDGVKRAKSGDNILVQKGNTQGDTLLIQLRSREKSVDEEGKAYDKIYDKRDGYERPADFWEIPMWMAEAANTFDKSDIFIIRNVDNAIAELNKAGYPTIMFSVLDTNKAIIKKIASKYKGKIIVGGYVDPKYFAGLKNVTFHESVKSAAKDMGVPYKPGVSYEHFKDTETIPRLCLSKGCRHKCAFCVVPKTILVSPKTSVDNQLKAFKDLKFKLIYLDDKTFGQAENYKDLTNVYSTVKKDNPDFDGFIIQTTAPQLMKMSDQFLKDSHIRYVELGVESYNDDILAKVNKPHRTKQLDQAVVKLRKNGISFIPNVIVGMAGKGWAETRNSYENTMQFLHKNADIISHVNVYNLALYEGTELHEQLNVKADTDINEQASAKSFHEDKDIHDEFYKRVLDFMSENLDNDPMRPIALVRYMKTGTVKTMNPEVLAHRTDILGKEKGRLIDDPEVPKRLHYYIEGGKEEPHIAKLPYKYRAIAPAGRFYDTMKDPLNLRENALRRGQGRADPNLAERMMKDAGYIGYYSQDRGPAIAVVFVKLPVERVTKGEIAARSSESYAKEAKARQDTKFIGVIRRAFPTATEIKPQAGFVQGYEIESQDAFHVKLPNGAWIQVKFNAMPVLTDEQMDKFREDYVGVFDTTNKIPMAIWVPDANVSLTGHGVIWIAGLGDLQTDVDHESFHAAKSIVLTPAEIAQLNKDYPKGDEQQAIAYENWRKTNRSNKMFDKIRSFFRRIAEAFGLGKGKSFQIFRQTERGKIWTRRLKGKVLEDKAGKLRATLYGMVDELPRYKGKEDAKSITEQIENDYHHWTNLGAVLYIEEINGREWTAEMTAQLKEHYGVDKLPQGTVKTIRTGAEYVFKTRTRETLTGRLPTMEALMEMEQRGAVEGGMAWYDSSDGMSMLVENEDGDLVARSARSELEEYFGPDAEFMAGLIAHLSSGLQVPANTMKAIEVYIAHKLGQSFKGTHQVSKPQIDEFLESRMTSGPKRLPFFDAIMGDANAIVIDRWMARVLGFRTYNKKREEWVTSTGASEAQRKLLIAWVQRGAKRLGINDRAYQALIWAGKKALDEEAAGRPTGSMDPLYKVIEEKIKVAGILAKDIPEGREKDYFILPGIDKWAINIAKFMPLKDHLLMHTKRSRKPMELSIPKAKDKPITASEQKRLEAQQQNLFARMADPSTAVEDSLDDIFGSRHKGILQKIKDGWKQFSLRTQILDEFHPILEHLGERTYKLHRMLNGVHASVEAFMRHGKLTLNDDGAIVADGVNRGFAVWAKKHGRDAVNVLRWAAAKRSEQLERDNPEFLKNEEFLTQAKRERIYKEIGDGPVGGGTWESLHAEFDEFHQSVLDIAEKSGIIDSKMRKDWGDLIYVPFYRVFEDVDTREEFLANPKKAKDIAAKAKRIKGSKRKIGEPLENVIANWGYMIQESMRNQARAEAYVNGKLLNPYADIIDDIDYQEITNTTIDNKGVITYDTKKGDTNVLSFLDKGKRKYFTVNDPELYHALTTVNAKHFGKLFNAFFGGPKRLLTYGATFGPAFRVANAVRDTLHTWMITPGTSFTPFLDTFKGFVSSMREDEHYVAALAAGGLHGGSYVHAEDPTSMSKFTKRLLNKDKDSVLLDTGAKILDFWDKLGTASENAARVQLHRNLVEKGEGTLEAAYQARDLLDFALKGQAKIVMALIRTIPFLGARAQGNYRLARAAFDPKTRSSMALKGAILAAASLALWAAFKDDDRYKELEDYDKWTYYHWWVGDQHYRMPKPFEVGAIFSSAFESAASTMTDSEEIEFLGRFVTHTLTETFAVGVPQTVKPLAELWANKSFFTGRPIEGKAMQALKPGERAEPWTSETLQLLGKGLNLSPKKMEALARGYFATLSAFFLGGTDQVARWVGDFPERPTYRSDDYPLIGRFWKQGPARNTKYATRLYEAMTESDMLVQTVKHYMIEDNMEAAKSMANANLGKFTANKMLNRTRKKLTTLRRVMKDVERSTTMTREEKRARLDELTVLRNDFVTQAYGAYMDAIK